MALHSVISGTQALAADADQFRQLLTGLMTDQAVQVQNLLGLGIAPTYGLHVLGNRGRFQALASPSAPTVTPNGTTGATNYSYYVVAKDAQGNKTLASATTSIANGNAALSGTNYNAVSWAAVAGAVGYDVIRSVGGASQGSIALGQSATSLNDTGLAASAYTAPSRNTTGDLVADGLQVGAGDTDTSLTYASMVPIDRRQGAVTIVTGQVTGVTIKDNTGATTVETWTYTYNTNGTVNTAQLVAGGKTVTWTFTYSGLSLTGWTKTVA